MRFHIQPTTALLSTVLLSLVPSVTAPAVTMAGEPIGKTAFVTEMSANKDFQRAARRGFESWDADVDGKLSRNEAEGKSGVFLTQHRFNTHDLDSDDAITLVEYRHFETTELFYAMDVNRDQQLDEHERAKLSDPNRYLKIIQAGKLGFTIDGDRVLMSGYIRTKSKRQLRNLLKAHPELKTVVFAYMPGSLDEDAMLAMAYMIQERGLDTHACDNARLYSGAVDLFLSGKNRTVGKDVEFGVHTWAMGRRKQGRRLAKDHRLHKPYLKYYRKVGIDESFYWFSLEAADQEAMYVLSEAEIKRFNVTTE